MALGLQRSDGQEHILTVISRVRRAMPRNPDVMAICDHAEALTVKPVKSGRKSRDAEHVRAQTRLRVKRHREKMKANGGK